MRAVFLLQYVVYGQEAEYSDNSELALNRLITSLSFFIPLPTQIKLTYNEKTFADALISDVRSNWSKMVNTSDVAFRQAFIRRPGKLEQQEKIWMLTVEERAFDILLETCPYNYKKINLPWQKKYVQVEWNYPQE